MIVKYKSLDKSDGIVLEGFQTQKIVRAPNRARKSSCARLARVIMFSIMKDMDCGHWLEKHFFTQ